MKTGEGGGFQISSQDSLDSRDSRCPSLFAINQQLSTINLFGTGFCDELSLVQAFAGGWKFSRWLPLTETVYNPPMKSCLGLLFTLLVFTIVVGGGALIWYLSNTAEFSRTGNTSPTSSAPPPKAIPVRPQPRKPGQPPVAMPAREPGRR